MQLREADDFLFQASVPVATVIQLLLDSSEQSVVVVDHRGRSLTRVVDDSRDETHPGDPAGIDDAARKRKFEDVVLADSAREPNRLALCAEQAESDVRFIKDRTRSDRLHAVSEREFNATTASRPIDTGGNDRSGRFDGVGDALAVLYERLGVVEVGDTVEARVGAERRTAPPEGNGRCVGTRDHGFEGVEVGRSERVPSCRAVNSHDSKASVVCRSYHTPVVPWSSKNLCPPNRRSQPIDNAVWAHGATRETPSDIEPETLRATLDGCLDAASLTPAVLTSVSAQAVGPKVDLNGVVSRTAGVQLIYEDLRLTRSLVYDKLWMHLESPEGDTGADPGILAAGVLVSYGFYLLARTETANHAVETIHTFGRDQTCHRLVDGAARPKLGGELEVNICTLTVIAGTTAVGSTPSTTLVEYAAGSADIHDNDLPPTGEIVSEGIVKRIAALY